MCNMQVEKMYSGRKFILPYPFFIYPRFYYMINETKTDGQKNIC